MTAETLRVIVVCAEPERQSLRTIEVPAGTTAWEAVLCADVQGSHPDIDFSSCGVGIYGVEVPRERVLAAGDRVEVLRPLPEDPRERRRRLARAGRSMGRG